MKGDEFRPDDHKLFDQIVVDPVLLYHRIEEFMNTQDEVDLVDIVKRYPLEHGITELTYYVKIAMSDYKIEEDATREDLYRWESMDADGNTVMRVAKLKHITLKRLQVPPKLQAYR